jgi:hypothetical protein
MTKNPTVTDMIRRLGVSETPLPEVDPIDRVAESFAPKPKREAILTTREATHGSFCEVARVAQELKGTITTAPGYVALNPAQREALDLIATKIGRILSGNPSFKDHWVDIAGYAKLGEEACEQ